VPKYTFAFVSGALVIIQGLSSFIVPPEQITWMRWRVGAFVVAILALVALAIQLYLQAEEEQRERKKQERLNRARDKKIDELLRRMPKPIRTRDSAVGDTLGLMVYERSLADRTEQLAHEYYNSLRDGITPNVYETKLKPQLLELLPELRKSPIKAGISDADIELKGNDLTGAVRQTADKLALVTAKLAHPRMKTLGNFLVLDEDISDDDTEEA
jgi:hypothetical protein